MKNVSIDTVLSKLNTPFTEDGTPLYYGLQYVKKNGEVGMKEGVIRAGFVFEPGKSTHNKPVATSKSGYSIKAKGLVPIFQEQTGQRRDIKKAQIVFFKDNNSHEWHKVVHS